MRNPIQCSCETPKLPKMDVPKAIHVYWVRQIHMFLQQRADYVWKYETIVRDTRLPVLWKSHRESISWTSRICNFCGCHLCVLIPSQMGREVLLSEVHYRQKSLPGTSRNPHRIWIRRFCFIPQRWSSLGSWWICTRISTWEMVKLIRSTNLVSDFAFMIETLLQAKLSKKTFWKQLNRAGKPLLFSVKISWRAPGCEFELQIARMECVEKGRNLIIAVMLEPLSVDDKMSRSVERLIRKNTYIEWPDDPSNREHFWKKLRSVLESWARVNSLRTTYRIVTQTLAY